MRTALLLIVVSLSTACAYHNPTAPTPPPPTPIVQVPPTPLPTPTPTPTPPLAPLTVRLLGQGGTAGTALDFGVATSGEVTTAVWTFGDGAIVTTSVPFAAHVYGRAGTFAATVVITDTLGRTAGSPPLAVTVSGVSVPGPPPAPSLSVSLAASPSTVTAGSATTLTATATPANGAAAPDSYAWDCNGDGVAETTTRAPITSATCVYPSVGFVAARVVVTAGSLTSSGATVITVTAAPPPPPPPPVSVLSASMACTTGTHGPLGTPTVCNVSASYGGAPIPSGAITSVAWDWGDGFTNTTVPPTAPDGSRLYGTAGTYTVFATVTATTVDGIRTATTTKVIGVP